MEIKQSKFKTRKPIGLTLDFLENQQPQQEILPQAQEINQFHDIFNQFHQSQQIQEDYPQNQQHQKNDQSCSFEAKDISIEENYQNQKVQNIIFEEYYPQAHINTNNIDPIQIDQNQRQNNNYQLIQEPPAPKNKDSSKKSFSQKGLDTKKKIQIQIPEVEHNNNSSYEQTMIKQQLKQNQMNNGCDLELKSQILQLQNDKDRIKNQYQLEIIELNTKIQELQTKLEIEKLEQMQLKQENLELENHISQIDYKIVETNSKEQQYSNQNKKLNDKEKIQYLIEKLNVKSTQNAKLHYEIIKLQNNVELLETQSILQQNNVNQIINHDKQQCINQVPQYLGRGVHPQVKIQYKKDNIKTNMMMNQKQSISNLSANHSQSDQNKNMNFSTMITPQAQKNNVSASIHKNLTLHQTKTAYFKEDTLQQIRKIQSTKNSTSIGELNIFKQDQTNYQNILQKMMRKETPYSPGKQIHATQKFKEALDSKLNYISDKQKPCASLLFSGVDFNKSKSKNKDTNCRQNSPHINEEIQYKSKQLFSYKPYPNSRKQSETIKSEESHQQSNVQAKYQNLIECTNYQTKDIFQMMKDINNQKIGISAKINYKKKCDARYEQQSNLRQYKYNLF